MSNVPGVLDIFEGNNFSLFVSGVDKGRKNFIRIDTTTSSREMFAFPDNKTVILEII